jgi:deoxyribose-phosphate aldolase
MKSSKEFQKLELELNEMRNAAGNVCLKTILETGEIQDYQSIVSAAEMAIKCGADFVKTSTGKSQIGATPEAVQAICDAVKAHAEQTSTMVGVKVSGGIRSLDQAQKYSDIVRQKLGEEWLKPQFFRIGASSLAKDLFHLF